MEIFERRILFESETNQPYEFLIEMANEHDRYVSEKYPGDTYIQQLISAESRCFFVMGSDLFEKIRIVRDAAHNYAWRAMGTVGYNTIIGYEYFVKQSMCDSDLLFVDIANGLLVMANMSKFF